jgi:multidrug efflux pump
MTSLAFILGCVPLAIATGASANSRHSIGTGVIGGMLGATVIAVFFIPMFFWGLETMSSRSKKKKGDEAPAADAKPHNASGSGSNASPSAPNKGD